MSLSMEFLARLRWRTEWVITLMPECHPLPQQIGNHFFLLLWATRAHTCTEAVGWCRFLSTLVLVFCFTKISIFPFLWSCCKGISQGQTTPVGELHFGNSRPIRTIWATGDHKAGNTTAGNTGSLLYTRPFGIWSPPSYLFLQFRQAVHCVCRLSSAFHSHNSALLPPGPATSEGITIS